MTTPDLSQKAAEVIAAHPDATAEEIAIAAYTAGYTDATAEHVEKMYRLLGGTA